MGVARTPYDQRRTGAGPAAIETMSRCHRPRSSSRRQVMQQEEPGRGGLLGPLAALRKIASFKPAAASDRLGWVGLEAARFRETPTFELNQPALTHHKLVLVIRPPEELEMRFEGVKRHVPPPAERSSWCRPAARTARASGCKDQLHIFLEAGRVTRVAAEAFDLDPARLTLPPLDALGLPHLRTAMGAVGAELASGGPGGPL